MWRKAQYNYAMPSYLNFELQITELDDQTFWAAVLDAPQEIVTPPDVQFRAPFDERALRNYMLVLSGQRNPRGMTRAEAAKRFGEQLFRTVFVEDVLESYQQALYIARQQQKWLRIRLNLNKAGRLASLPWEYLRDPQIDFLTLSRATPIIRYPKQWVNPVRLEVELPLRILVMISAPEGLPTVDEATERRNLEKALVRLKARGLVEVDYLEDASLRNLQRILRQGEYHVFHYIGHSAFDAERGEGFLMLEDSRDHIKPDPVRGEFLARELHEEDTLRLVVLNSCQGAVADARDPFSGVASSLVKRGIPAVVAQQFEITDKAAIAFSEEFYRAIAEGFSVEAAVSEGRRAILGVAGDSIEWGTPVLFLHDEGNLFNFPRLTEPETFFGRLYAAIPPMYWAVLFVLMIFIVLIGSVAGFTVASRDPIDGLAPPTATIIPDVDLVVQDVRISPRNPKPGELVAVFIDIANQGTDPSPPFTYEWQGSIFDSTSRQSFVVDGLAPGGVLHDNFTTRFGWWGIFISETRLDIENVVLEPNEQNSRANPIRMDTIAPFVIDFSEALPNGDFVRENQQVPFGLFAPWGFEVEALSDSPECLNIVPWFKFIGISNVVLGTGLPDNPDVCADGRIQIRFPERRSDNNVSGIGAVTVNFAPGAGRRALEVYADPLANEFLGATTAFNSRRNGLRLVLTPSLEVFESIYLVELSPLDGAPLEISSLSLSAP